MRYIVVDINKAVVRALEREWASVALHTGAVALEVFHGTLAAFVGAYRPAGASAIVAPANSVSFMGGGFDRALLEALGAPGLDHTRVEAAVQARALARHHGYLPRATVHRVDLAEVFAAAGVRFETTSAHAREIRTLLQVPTMVVPEPTSGECVFDCVWNALNAADTDTVILPGFGAGYGGLAPEAVARVMVGAVALFHARLPPLAQAAAVLVFLQKDYRRLGLARDVRAVGAHMSEHGRSFVARMAADGARVARKWPSLGPKLSDAFRCSSSARSPRTSAARPTLLS